MKKRTYTEKELIKKIKEKKELSGLTDSLVEEFLSKHLKEKELKGLSSSQIKIIIKKVRAGLRSITGQFQKSRKNRTRLLEAKKIKKLLETHFSTKERLEFYPQLKNLIKKLNIHSILDLGCGLNPLALANKEIKYYASDINEAELSLIEKFFINNKINGKTFVYDLRKTKYYENLPKADLCLLLKVIDFLDYETTEKLLKFLNSKYIIVSFSTKKLSGKPMNKPRRIWFENLLKNLNLNFKIFSSRNEIFYIIKKN